MQPETPTQESLFGRTSPEHSAPTEAQTSKQSLTKWGTAGRISLNGLCWTHNISECPSGDAASFSSLSSILQSPETVLTRYSLSPKAVNGIVNRLEKQLGSTAPTGNKTSPDTANCRHSKWSGMLRLFQKHKPLET